MERTLSAVDDVAPRQPRAHAQREWELLVVGVPGDRVPAPPSLAERVKGRPHTRDMRGLVVRGVERGDDADVVSDSEDAHGEHGRVEGRRLMSAYLGGALVS